MFKVNPYLLFKGECLEAMNFYAAAFDGEVDAQKIGESAVAEQIPSDKHNQILHASLIVNGEYILHGSDMARENMTIGNAISIIIMCESQQELENFYSNLLEGGESIVSPKVEFWGDVYAELVDRFGVRWQFNFATLNQS